MDKVRIDKWLWAARFFKTRALAKNAIENGKVQIDGQKPKPSRMLELGVSLTIRQGYDEKIVDVIRLSDQRRGAPQAQELYRETNQSIAVREKAAAERKALNSSQPHHEKPNKKQRRQIHRFIRG
ncbi:MAG: RNA-binding protein [Cellvibrionales bacterium TMED47]|nr:RNA-binding protein [Porticoccaceae bacterium]RPG83931.1 MAG: RNA-binding protein [Cellvibrionales bacterium TMED47]